MRMLLECRNAFQMVKEEGLRFADCRFSLGNPDAGREAYNREHITGAVYFDLEKDLSGPLSLHGGRHPLPDTAGLAEKLACAGITPDTPIAAYDNGLSAAAARFIWLLHHLGHRKAYLLNGGYTAWKNEGLPVSGEVPDFPRAEYSVRKDSSILADTEEVRRISAQLLRGDKGTVLIDSRERRRWLGEEEPIDHKAGRIPGAVCYFWEDAFSADGRLRPAEEQKQRFASLNKEQEIIVYCGSGITASANYLALKEAGFSHVKLYDGSFSGWISYDEHPVETGETGDH